MSEIFDVKFNDESRQDFLTYSEEVLTERAVPSAEDGLLSSQRKLLWTMSEYLKMDSSSKTKKCQSVVGSTLLTSYFHGDKACYGVLVKMAQPFLMRYPLVDGQGALGTQESNDMVASSRYTEAKPSIYADLMMENFKKNAVPLKRTYNDEFDEPIVLPSSFPNALCNGKQTIAIGLSHNSLPNNLSEVCDALVAYMQNEDISIDEIMSYLPGPDFPCGGIVVNRNDIKEAFATGKSKVSLKVRGDYTIEGNKIIFTSIPYRTYRNNIKEQMTKCIEELETVIADYADESNLGKTKIIFKIKPGVEPEAALQKLFKLTDLQTTLSYNMNYIVNGTPRLCSIKDLMKAYVQHQENVLLNVTYFDKDKAEKRIHVLEGILIAIDKIDDVIQLIKSSTNKADARTKLINFLSIDEVQANAILDMKLSRLTKLDKDELSQELQDKKDFVAECNKIIGSHDHRLEKITEKVQSLKKKYGDARRTQLTQIEIPKESKSKPEFIPEPCGIVITTTHTIKRMAKTVKPKTNEYFLMNQETDTNDWLSVFTAAGKMYKIQTKDIPEGTTASKGIGIAALLEMGSDTPIAYFLHSQFSDGALLFVTSRGQIKCAKMEEFTSTRKGGIIATKLREGDSVTAVMEYHGEDVEVITKKGMSIHLRGSDIPTQGKNTLGVKGINVAEDDSVAQVLLIPKDTIGLVVIAETGQGKRVPVSELPPQGRGGKGVSITPKNDFAGAVFITKEDSRILFVMPSGVKSESARQIPLHSRVNTGVQIIKPIGKIAHVVLGS